VAQRRLDLAHLRLCVLQGPRANVWRRGVRCTVPKRFSHRCAIARAVSVSPAVLLRARRPQLEPSSWGQYTACTSYQARWRFGNCYLALLWPEGPALEG
jgi:hypothetical protein